MKKNACILYTGLILSLLLIGPGNSSFAQGRNRGTIIQAYPTAGLAISQIEGDCLKGFKKKGFSGGVGAMIPLDKYQQWQLNVETSFSQRGVYEGSFDPNIQYRIFGFSLNYVDIPVMLYYRDPYGGIQLGLGLSYSRLVQQPHGTILYSEVIPDTTDMSFLRNDFAIIGSVRFPLWKHLKLDIRCQYSLLPIKKDWTFTDYHFGTPPRIYVNNCYNFSFSTRLLWMFGEPEHYRNRRKR